MSKRAEEAALKAYPVSMESTPLGPVPVDVNEYARKKYQEGYEQAEKDLALTGEDMRLAFSCVNEAIDNCDGKTKQEIFEDALRRFNETKDKQR